MGLLSREEEQPVLVKGAGSSENRKPWLGNDNQQNCIVETPLVVLSLRVHAPMQGTGFSLWSGN